MKIIDNLIVVSLNENEYMYINGINGAIDVIQKNIHEKVAVWIKNKIITVKEVNQNKKITNYLLKKEYIVSDDFDEWKYKKKIIDSIKKRDRKYVEKIESVMLVLTYECNFSCPYCFEEDVKNNNENLTEEMIDEIIKLYNGNLKYITLYGGEPLLPKNKKIVKYIIDKLPNAIYSIISNGYYLDLYYELFQKINVKQIQITLDGDEKNHNKTRKLKNGEDTYHVIFKNIKKFLHSNIPIKIRMNIDKDSFKNAVFLRNNLIREFRDHLDILSFEISPLFQMTNKTKSELNYELYDLDLNNHNIPIENLNALYSNSNPIINYLLTKSPFYPIISTCNAHSTGRIFDPKGNIYSCLISVGKTSKSIGTYFPNFQLKNNSMITRNIDTINKCRKCKYSLLCGGGCSLHLENLNHENCDHTLNNIYNIIPKIYNMRMKNESANYS